MRRENSLSCAEFHALSIGVLETKLDAFLIWNQRLFLEKLRFLTWSSAKQRF